MIEFGEWLPDQAELDSQGSAEAKNVVPSVDGYRPFNSLLAVDGTLNARCVGAFAAQTNAKLSYNYAGTRTKLYQLVDGTWTDQSKASGTYAVSDDDYWEWAKFGEKIITVGGINTGTPVPPQIITMGAVGATEFADLGGSPPQARHIAVVRDFVVLANLYEGAARYPSRVRWSGVNDETKWGTDPAAQSDYQDIPGYGGWIQRVVGGAFGTIVLERSIFRMDYIGPPLVFAFNETLPALGTNAKNSVVQYGDTIFFLGLTGFEAVTDASRRNNIGLNKIDRWFFRNCDLHELDEVIGALDRKNRRVFWLFHSVTGSRGDGVPDMGIVFDISTGRWSYFENAIEWVYDAFGEDYTLEGLDNISTNIDTGINASLDSTRWIGGFIDLGAFDPNHISGRFEGNPLTATIDTKEQRLGGDKRTIVTKIRPEIEGGDSDTTLISCAYRNRLDDDFTWTNNAVKERDGNHAVRADARFHKFRVTIPDNFTKAIGVTVVDGKQSSKY